MSNGWHFEKGRDFKKTAICKIPAMWMRL
jgi:hypothetical protein